MAKAMTTQQVTDLRHHTAKIRRIHEDLELKHHNEWGDGTDPNLTLALEVSALTEAIRWLDLADSHHIKEGW
jgi:hypothetical protein